MRTLFALLLLWPLALFAADGDDVGPRRVGSEYHVAGRYLCHNKVAADAGSSCDMLSDHIEFPAVYHFVVTETAGCSAWDLTVRTALETTSDQFDVCQLTNTTVQDCYILTDVDGPLHGNFQVAITTATDCTDLDVVAEFYTRKKLQ